MLGRIQTQGKNQEENKRGEYYENKKDVYIHFNGGAVIAAGEVIKTDGSLDLTGGGIDSYGIGERFKGVHSHVINRKGVVSPDKSRLLAYKEAGGTVKGMGLKISYDYRKKDMWT